MSLRPGEWVKNELTHRISLCSRTCSEQSRGAVFLATINGSTVGCLGIRRLVAHRCAHNARFALDVAADHQGMGVGFRLLQAGDTWAQQRKIGRFEMTFVEYNAAASKLYQRYGYTLEGRRRVIFTLAGQPCDQLYTEKSFVRQLGFKV